MVRSTKDWRGKTDDSKAPPTVRQRVFDRDGGKCHLCQVVIKPVEGFELDHVVALINGGSNTEGNLAPAHKHCHLAKTRLDLAEKSKVAAIRQRFTGAKQPAGNLKSAGFTPSEKTARRSERAAAKAPLPFKPLFAQARQQP